MHYINGVHYKDVSHDVYCYELCRDYIVDCGMIGYSFESTYYALSYDGVLVIKAGYRWDGASGPAINTDTWVRGSLVHDALYQMLREGELHKDSRKRADKIMYSIIRLDGMNWFRAKWSYYAVRLGGKNSAIKREPLE